MSIQTIHNSIASIDREINSLQTQIGNLDRNIIAKSKEANTYMDRIRREKDLNRLVSLNRDYNRKQEEMNRIERDKTGKEKTLADKRKKKADLQQQLLKEEKTERDKAKKESDDLLRLQERITREIQQQQFYSRQAISTLKYENPTPVTKQYDVFISHASEDKDDFVRPLAKALIELGVEVWYDENEIKLGQSIRKSIDKGLASSRYGLVVLSKPYMTKYWTGQELDGLFAKGTNDSILPIWHKISKDEIKDFSPMLLGILGLNTAIHSIEHIANEVAGLVNAQKVDKITV